jgi:hypothetical protein
MDLRLRVIGKTAGRGGTPYPPYPLPFGGEWEGYVERIISMIPL